MNREMRIEMAPGGPEVSRLCYGVWRLLDDPRGAGESRVLAKIAPMAWSPTAGGRLFAADAGEPAARAMHVELALQDWFAVWSAATGAEVP